MQFAVIIEEINFLPYNTTYFKMPRVKASPKKCMKSNIQQPNNSWVILLKDEALELSENTEYTGSGTPDVVTLKHPKSGQAAVFLFSTANNSVQEILTFSEGKRSWFIDDSVKSDGKMHLSTPVDPLFLGDLTLRKVVDIVYVYCFCDGNALATVRKCHHIFLNRRTPNYQVVSSNYSGLGELGISNAQEAGASQRQNVDRNEGVIDAFLDNPTAILPYLQKYCTSQAIPLNHLLHDEEFPETERLLKSSGLKYLSIIADRKGDEELNAFKYNEEKTLSWLKKKTERVAEILQQKNIHVTSGGAVSSTFIKSSRDMSDKDVYLRYAHGIVSEYLMDNLSRKLLKYLCLPEDSQGVKRKNLGILGHDTKKAKIEENSKNVIPNILNLSKPDVKIMKSTISSSKEMARLKAAGSSKTISSYFKKN